MKVGAKRGREERRREGRNKRTGRKMIKHPEENKKVTQDQITFLKIRRCLESYF